MRHQTTSRTTRAASRRTVMRAAAHSAWAVPVVSAVAAAPASAATSGGGGIRLVVESAQFWVVKATRGNGSWWVVPLITIRNPGPLTTGFPVVTMHFPTHDFTGVIPPPQGPATPYFNNVFGLYGGLGSEAIGPQTAADTEVTLEITRYTSLEPGSRLTLGTGPVPNPGALAWYNQPTVATIAFEVDAGTTGFALTAGSMTRAVAPTS